MVYGAQHWMVAQPTWGMTPSGVVLGATDCWRGALKPKWQPDIKESIRWVEGYTIVADLAETVPGSRLVYITDREGDIRAVMNTAAERDYPADYLIRSKHNRKTSMGEQLWDGVGGGEAGRWIERAHVVAGHSQGGQIDRRGDRPFIIGNEIGVIRCCLRLRGDTL